MLFNLAAILEYVCVYTVALTDVTVCIRNSLKESVATRDVTAAARRLPDRSFPGAIATTTVNATFVN
jgi:hypothetical protein